MIKAPTIRRLAANDSYTFLMQELERIDDQILEPLSATDWPRDMPVITGGGLIESISSIDVTYASTGKDDDNLFFDAANEIPVIQADMTKQVARTFNFAEYMSFTVTEKEKMASVGRDPETFLNKGIRLHCDKVIDRNVYKGFTKRENQLVRMSSGMACHTCSGRTRRSTGSPKHAATAFISSLMEAYSFVRLSWLEPVLTTTMSYPHCEKRKSIGSMTGLSLKSIATIPPTEQAI